jgi:NAD(P)-dependent dehydrogenase (short-subunit alcohol dehydrogenase family)
VKAIITGAASGIGRAVAGKLAAGSPGSKLLVTDRSGNGLETLIHDLADRDVEIEPFVADITRPEDCVAIVERMEARFGGVDAIVSNAGGVRGGLLKELAIDAFDYSFALNTRPTWLLAKAAYPMLCASRGSIVATASTAAEYPTSPLGTYGASKAALVMLVKQMAAEWGRDGIRCNIVSPGPTVTGITQPVYADPEARRTRVAHIPLGRLGEADDIAEAILFLIDRRASHITGVNLTVDGGMIVDVMRPIGAGTGNLRNE